MNYYLLPAFIKKLKNMSKLYDWVFHFNHFEGVWSAIPRDVYNKYWDNDDVKGVMKSKDINVLIEMIIKEIKVK